MIKLDNPVWHSLSEAHKDFSLNYENVKFYHPDYCPFGGFESNDNISHQLDEYSGLISNFFIVGNKPQFSNKLILKNELVCLQMIIENKIDIEIRENIIMLNNAHEDELFKLVDFVQPGYFKKKTSMMGNYYGVFVNYELVAVTGERMKMNDYSEVSAVVTHPLHTGKGYAKQLVSHVVNKIFEENKTPYLHVAEKNTGAVNLYEKLGFTTRKKISFWNFIKTHL